MLYSNPMEIDIQKYKTMLEEEKATLEKELASVGRVNPDNPADWEPRPSDLENASADANDGSDADVAFETNSAILKQLEIRLIHINGALERIEKGTYGIDEVDGSPIETERLNANPAARTSKKNIEKESELE